MRVLIVDDYQGMRLMIRRFFSDAPAKMSNLQVGLRQWRRAAQRGPT